MARGNFVRQMKVFMTAVAIFFDYKMTQKKEKWTRASAVNRLWDRTHKRNAARLMKVVVKLEGLWVKLGQYMSTRADVLPDAYIQSLKLLQDSLPPRPVSEVNETIQKELGKSPKELFKSFDNTPLATASIAQVHKAETKEGVKVVVKVQHQGIKDVILQDLKNAQTIVRWVAWAEPQYNFAPVMDEWCNEVPKELDFNIEAENTRKVAENLGLTDSENSNDSITVNKVDVLIPKILEGTERVLILEYMDGVRLSDKKGLDGLGFDKQAFVETVTKAYAHQIFIDGFFNADPHPGNFLISKEAPYRPVLLDFGLTKSLSFEKKQALAKLLLACAEGDYASLLSAFAEVGLKLRLDLPEEAMEVTTFFFRRSVPAKQSIVDMRKRAKENDARMKRVEEKLKEDDDSGGQVRNPVDAFPGDLVFFMRVLNLLRGMSSMLDTQVVYLEIMRPFAEAALSSGQAGQRGDWIHSAAVHSDVEEKLRIFLRQMGEQNRILGTQVCAYKNGEVIIDTAAGVLGKYDPRPVESDSLFPVFSSTKGVTAGILHWLASQGKLDFHEKVATYWPEFGVNNKENITVSSIPSYQKNTQEALAQVAHVLNHTAGLQNALQGVLVENPMITTDWTDMLKRIAEAVPETPAGEDQQYHTLTYGWLCGGIAEKASGQSLQKLLEEALVNPLDVQGEFYIGIPPGVESRLASLTLDVDELKVQLARSAAEQLSRQAAEGGNAGQGGGGALGERIMRMFGSGQVDAASSLASLPFLFNTLYVRRAIIPSANGHFSARALARYYASLATGVIPSRPTSSEPPLGSHLHNPIKAKPQKKNKDSSPTDSNSKVASYSSPERQQDTKTLFTDRVRMLDAFNGRGEYAELAKTDGNFGLGFIRMGPSSDAEPPPVKPSMAFGHSGLGGSTGYCDPANDFAIAITLNKMNVGDVTAEIVQFVTKELNIPCPAQFVRKGAVGVDMRIDTALMSVGDRTLRPPPGL